MSRHHARKAMPESDAMLLSMQRSRKHHYRELLHSTSPAQREPVTSSSPARHPPPAHRHHILQSEPYFTPSPSQSPVHGHDPHNMERVWERLEKNPNLARELQNQYGLQAREMATKEYSSDNSGNQQKLIDDLIATRNRQFSERKSNNASQLRALNEERRKLMEERDKLEHRKRQAAILSPDSDYGSEAGSRASRRPTKVKIIGRTSPASVFDVSEYVSTTNNNLPAQIEHLNKLRGQYERRVNRLVRPYNGELGPQSYQSWQMPHYYLARSIVEEIAENFLDLYFKSHRPVVSNDQALALMEKDARHMHKQREGLREARLAQLIMEELVLEETYKYAHESAREYRNLHAYIKNRSDMHFMRQGEAVATREPSGRAEEDPLYHLITKGYFQRQKDRFKKRKDIWSHRQHAHVKDQPKQEADEPEDEADAEIEVLYFGDIIPVETRDYNAKPHDSYPEKIRKRKFAQYMVPAKNYWQKMWCDVKQLELSPKCRGVTTASVSRNNRLLALGTAHGDLLIYDIAHRPYRILRALVNSSKTLDPIDCIAWSLDGSKLLTTNTVGGTAKAWSWNASGIPLARQDLKDLSIQEDDAGYLPLPLRNVLDLDVDRFETKFQSGPFSEMDLHKSVYGPTMAAFFPTMSLFGHQTHAVIALDNGDVLKCDLEENYKEQLVQQDGGQGGAPTTMVNEVPKIYKPTIPTEYGVSRIGQGVPAELMRQHNFPLICMGFVENHRKMVTVDQRGFINTWRYHPKTLNSYSYFRAHKQHRIDFNKTMYAPSDKAKPVLVFSDRAKTGSRVKTRQEIARERDEIEKQIRDMRLPDPWHKQPPNAEGLETTIYAPLEQVSESGATFHIIIRKKQNNQLTSYVTRVYKPVKIKSTKMIGCRLTPDGKELIFVFLFPEYPPKTAHLSIVRVDVCDMVMVDWRRDLIVDPVLYQRIVEEDIVSFDVSQVHGATGSAYIFMNIAGDLHGYSLTTGLKVLRSYDRANPDKPFKGATVGASSFQIADCAQISVANYAGRFFLIIYSSSKRETEQAARNGKNKKLHNIVKVIELLDFNKDPQRLEMWELYSRRPDKAPLPPNTHVINQRYSRTALNHHRTAYVTQIINDMIDDVIEAKTRRYTDEELKEFEDLDRVRNYEELEPEIEGRRTPPEEGDEAGDDYDPAAMQRGLSPVQE